MGTKKKFLGGYGLLFGVFCCLFVGFLSTSCFARTTLTDDESNYIVNYLFNNTYGSQINNSSIINTYYYSDVLNASRFSSSFSSAFKDYFNNNNDLDFDTNNLIFHLGLWYTNPRKWCLYWCYFLL